MKRQILKIDVEKGFLKETFPYMRPVVSWTQSLGMRCGHQQLLAMVQSSPGP